MCCDGYMYTKKNTKNTSIRWECSQKRGLDCLGAINTNLEVQSVISSKAHNHGADFDKIEATKAVNRMKEGANISRGRPQQLLVDILQPLPVEVRAAAGTTNAVKQKIRREMNKHRPKDPASLQELDLTDDWQHTGEPYRHPFLLHDSGKDADNRILVFGTAQALRHLCASNTWYMDGTHPPTPGLFKQLYVLRAPLGTTAVTCLYALLPGKSQDIYEELFRAVDQKCEELGLTPDPTTVITDFEQAVLKAFGNTFGDHVIHQGCFFHLAQNTWRCIQRLGLVELYKRDDNVKLFCGMVDALAFLPVEDVAEGMDFLKQTAPEAIEDLITYFDRTYVNGTYRRIQPAAAADQQYAQPMRVRRIQPLFPPPLWNVHQATLANTDRTNNLCESWNLQFQRLLGYNHPTVWVAIEAFRKDQSVVETALFNNANGAPPKKRVKKSTTELQQRLQNLCTDYVSGTKGMEEFLRAVGRTIRW